MIKIEEFSDALQKLIWTRALKVLQIPSQMWVGSELGITCSDQPVFTDTGYRM